MGLTLVGFVAEVAAAGDAEAGGGFEVATAVLTEVMVVVPAVEMGVEDAELEAELSVENVPTSSQESGVLLTLPPAAAAFVVGLTGVGATIAGPVPFVVTIAVAGADAT